MKFFFVAFLILTALGAVYYFFIDGPGSDSGAGLFTSITAVIAVGVGGFNWIRYGSPLAEAPNLNGRK